MGDGYKLLLFDLDGTLLKSDKTVSARNLRALRICRERGSAVGVATSRSEKNAKFALRFLDPDVLIANGGASVKVHGRCVYTGAFAPEETERVIAAVRGICGPEVNMDIDTEDCCWRNYSADVFDDQGTWGETRATEFEDFRQESLMACVEIPVSENAERLRRALPFADILKFTDGDWYKLTRSGVTKEAGIMRVCRALDIRQEDIAAFGDDFSDIGMLRLSGLGVAMANAVPEVKTAADVIIGDNNSDAIAEFLDNLFSLKEE